MQFELSEKECEKFRVWDKNHRAKCKLGHPMSCGAIGGRLTFSFTPTGVGVIANVKCACGEEICVTDLDEW